MKTVIEMAEEAGATHYWHLSRLERFAELVRADERARMAEQPAQQEPVAWMDGYRNIYSLEEKAAGCPEATIALVPMANHKKTSGSPIKELNCICGAVWEGDELVHLPRPPAQRTWVGLSDLNIDELENEYMKSAQTAHEFLRAIEAKLKEKNT